MSTAEVETFARPVRLAEHEQAWLLAESAAGRFLAGYRGHTRDAYRGDLRRYFEYLATLHMPPLEASRAHLELFARHLEDTGAARSTVARRLSTVTGYYRYCLDEGFLERSPAAHVRRPRMPDESPTLGLDRAELGRFLDAARAAGPRDRALVGLLAMNGLRASEAVNVDVSDLTTERGHRVLTITGKGGRRDAVPLAAPVLEALDEYLAGRELGPLFLTERGERLSRHGVTRIVARLARAAGIAKRVSPHSLRHSFVTLALDAGVPLRDVQDAARHADPRTTRRYDRARGSLDRHATYALAAYLADA